MEQAKGFLEALFDFSFTSFITSRIVKLLYGLSIGWAALLALWLIVGGFNVSSGAGVFTLLILAPLVFLLVVAYARVMLELVIVIFRIAEHVAQIAQQRQGGSTAGTQP